MPECRECEHANLDMSKYDWIFLTYKCYCEKYSRYVEEKNTDCPPPMDCYITTAMCTILGFGDNCNELNVLRQFRDEYMAKTTIENLELLKEYRKIGPVISSKLIENPRSKTIAMHLLEEYIYPAISFIKNEEYKKAKDMYIKMVEYLKHKFYVNM